jgi:NADH-quinone oxidoreductase subunit L
MAIVLGVLAAGSLLVGVLGLPAIWQHALGVSAPFYAFLAPLFPAAATSHASAATEWVLMGIAVLVALVGIALAWMRYGRARAPAVEPARPDERATGDVFDAVYERVVVRFVDWLSESVLGRAVETTLARASLWTPADGAHLASRWLARLQTGNVQAYAFYVLAGLALTLWWTATHD